MTKINLREQYPDSYKTDTYVEVPDEIAQTILAFNRQEAAARRRTYYHKAFYSLDREDGIEYDAVFTAATPWEIYERKVSLEQLYAAFSALSNKQTRRIYAHFFLGLTMREIAHAEKASPTAVNSSIRRGLQRMKNFLEKTL